MKQAPFMSRSNATATSSTRLRDRGAVKIERKSSRYVSRTRRILVTSVRRLSERLPEQHRSNPPLPDRESQEPLVPPNDRSTDADSNSRASTRNCFFANFPFRDLKYPQFRFQRLVELGHAVLGRKRSPICSHQWQIGSSWDIDSIRSRLSKLMSPSKLRSYYSFRDGKRAKNRSFVNVKA